jgi:anhydro-N-acetylmuramic acid kinase
MTTTRILAGAMSGTSADGVDIAITQITGAGLSMSAKLLHHHHLPYLPSLRETIFTLRHTGQTSLRTIAQLGQDISLAYAAAIHQSLQAAKLQPTDITAIAAHGQTLFHDAPLTIQYLDPSLLANQTNIAVISDFRRADLAAGGQGAPLVPFADYLLFRHPAKSRILLNLGGIANLTYLQPGGSPSDVIAFDTGPANCVLDHIARQANLPQGHDQNGSLSLTGQAHSQIATTAIHNWKHALTPPPKSADTPEMIAAFEQAEKSHHANLSTPDRLATACLMTAIGIHLALSHLPTHPQEIIASGGGTLNPRLLHEIKQLTKLPLQTTDDHGLPSPAKEALAFALLGAATLDNLPSNLPSVTGASRSVILGSITPKP